MLCAVLPISLLGRLKGLLFFICKNAECALAKKGKNVCERVHYGSNFQLLLFFLSFRSQTMQQNSLNIQNTMLCVPTRITFFSPSSLIPRQENVDLMELGTIKGKFTLFYRSAGVSESENF